MRSKVEVEMAEDRIRELEILSTKFTQSDQHRGTAKKQMNRTSWHGPMGQKQKVQHLYDLTRRLKLKKIITAVSQIW